MEKFQSRSRIAAARKRLDASSVPLDGDPLSLLTTGNPKTAKGEKYKFLTAILHLAPEAASGALNVCPYASNGCAAACLNTAGRGGIGLDVYGLNRIQIARIKRTRAFQRDRKEFLLRLFKEIRRHVGLAKQHGLTPCVRLNGTSDLPWERFTIGELSLMELFPDVQFYDYTKWPIEKRGSLPHNYHLTYSLAEDNEAEAVRALDAGTNVAVVFATKKSADLPAKYELGGKARTVLDGDLTDLRFRDTEVGAIVGLRAKGRAKGSDTGFVRNPKEAS